MNITSARQSLASTAIRLALVLLIAFAANQGGYGQSERKIDIGEIVSVESSILNEKRDIWVYVPPSAKATIYAKRQFPVVYLLDGDAHFSSVVGMIQQLSTVNGNTISPEMIVVGIPNTDRTRDLTPTHVDSDPMFKDTSFLKTSGGGEKFIAFIEKELIPYIESKYPVAPYRMLIGHSFGGLTVMQSFVHHTGLFNSYVCIDPSMWWDNGALLAETKKALSEKRFKGKTLYLGIANTMDPGMNLKTVQKDKSQDSRHIRSILKLKGYFESNTKNGLKFQGKYYGDDDHGSVPLITEYDALHFIFSYYRMKFGPKDFFDPTVDVAGKFEKHFQNVSKEMGFEVKPTEDTINAIGYQVLGDKQFKKAEALFKLNVKNYPTSANVFDSYGDYFVAMGDKENAIAQFEKALSLKESPDTRKKLEKLQGK